MAFDGLRKVKNKKQVNKKLKTKNKVKEKKKKNKSKGETRYCLSKCRWRVACSQLSCTWPPR